MSFTKRCPVLQPIYVAPSHQRRGIATALLLDGVQSLAAQLVSRLDSNCNLGNTASMAWHLQSGFIEVPCIWTAGHRANIYLQEAERQEQLGLPTAVTMRELANYWSDQLRRLDAESRMLDN